MDILRRFDAVVKEELFGMEVVAMTEALALGLREAAAAVGLSHWTLRKYIAEGKIVPLRVGRRVLIEPSELRRFLGEARKASGADPSRRKESMGQ
jgi:excisionase family DNA binding protein